MPTQWSMPRESRSGLGSLQVKQYVSKTKNSVFICIFVLSLRDTIAIILFNAHLI